ncbi:hypothetical protein [Flagellimonas allohymeniacidonis]|uniref:Uncharacterized protein n=1 Tax=Flagellimonas allohymeniacidonis TaxID=2517819 RepID=A0A4Q8QDJ6_9FLAO|nr:hypothetical protein [Allomuricauda hymeniacidonis]TAI48461.1 hypothetical protein EW142_01260 [Allomuricauda hymeniacidonis]
MEVWAFFVSIFSLLVAGLAFAEARSANRIALDANKANIKMFKRQGIIELHFAWTDINEIDPENLISPHVVKAINALSLTSSLWNHDALEKAVIYQSYWNNFKQLYETLVDLDKSPPGKSEKCSELITEDIRRAYNSMNSTDLSKVISKL